MFCPMPTYFRRRGYFKYSENLLRRCQTSVSWFVLVPWLHPMLNELFLPMVGFVRHPITNFTRYIFFQRPPHAVQLSSSPVTPAVIIKKNNRIVCTIFLYIKANMAAVFPRNRSFYNCFWLDFIVSLESSHCRFLLEIRTCSSSWWLRLLPLGPPMGKNLLSFNPESLTGLVLKPYALWCILFTTRCASTVVKHVPTVSVYFLSGTMLIDV